MGISVLVFGLGGRRPFVKLFWCLKGGLPYGIKKSIVADFPA
ncbi:MAG: hypothetical protein Q4A49_05420 [Neisseria sp.]|nr:hypothetical protein [Neisseria sp.]